MKISSTWKQNWLNTIPFSAETIWSTISSDCKQTAKIAFRPLPKQGKHFQTRFFILSLDVFPTRFYIKKRKQHFQIPKDQIQIRQNVRNFCSDQKKAFSKPDLSHSPNWAFSLPSCWGDKIKLRSCPTNLDAPKSMTATKGAELLENKVSQTSQTKIIRKLILWGRTNLIKKLSH